uniref:AIG1-type G domain-containing protein n=1 Tax=Esox lucius TaxID=8010 RepID=A0A3P8Y1Y3_ESOLU
LDHERECLLLSSPTDEPVCHLPERRLLLLGGAGAGKSTAGNTILGEEVFQTGTETLESSVGHGEVCGRRITVVDTPGWGTPQESPGRFRRETKHGAALLWPGPHTILLVLPLVTDITDLKRQALKDHLEVPWDL